MTNKYAAMFWMTVLAAMSAFVALIGFGFLAAINANTVNIAIATVVVSGVAGATIVCVSIAGATIAGAIIAAAAAVVGAVVVGSTADVVGDIITTALFFLALFIYWGGWFIIDMKYREEPATAISLAVTFFVIFLIGIVPVGRLAYVQLIPKDEQIVKSLEISEVGGDLKFILNEDNSKYLKEFFFLKKDDGAFVAFKDAKYQLDRETIFRQFPDGKTENTIMEKLTIAFVGVERPKDIVIVVRHPFGPDREYKLDSK